MKKIPVTPKMIFATSGEAQAARDGYLAGYAVGWLQARDQANAICWQVIEESMERELGAHIAADSISSMEPPGRSNWQNIKTAPKDGTKILAWCLSNWGNGPVVVVWGSASSADGFVNTVNGDTEEPTHWLPIPEHSQA